MILLKKIIIKKEEKNFSFFKYLMFTYFKKCKIYDRYIVDDIFYLPFKKRLNNSYKKALINYLKTKKVTHFLSFEKELERVFKNTFCVIDGKNIYNTIFLDILNFITKGQLYEYELIFISDNIKEIKMLMEKAAKKVKSISVLTEKPHLYESIKDLLFIKYGVLLNIKTKKEKLKKHNKIYINCGINRVFNTSFFKNVNMIDIYKIYDGAYNNIILEENLKEKEYTKRLSCAFSLELAEYLYNDKKDKKFKIVNMKKIDVDN